jgi:hypothetical protein
MTYSGRCGVSETTAKPAREAAEAAKRPAYEPPRIQALTEREILNTFQITQSMATWWASGMC